MKINKKEEWFKVRYSINGVTKCVEKYGDFWLNYAEAKKEFDKLSNPKVYSANTVEWVELSYFPVNADDETIIEDWELSKQEKYLVELSKALS